MEVALLDGEGRRVADGEVGEICLRPKEPFAMFDGYFERPEATLESFEGLWYHTGDFGKALPSGAYTFVDRKKDSLRRRGENISSLELEAGIDRHPQVVESAVHALPSELGEDDVKVCLVLADGARLDPEELFAFFRQNLPYFAIPRYVDVIDALPRNGIGRVMKHKLREHGNTRSTIDFEALGLTAAWADVVVTMGCGDECTFVPGVRYVDWDLPDPAGRPVEEVRATRDEIDRRVRALVAELDSAAVGR
jgi:carnitine-CoA ligase